MRSPAGSVDGNAVAGLLACALTAGVAAWITAASVVDLYTAAWGPGARPGSSTLQPGADAPDFELRNLEGDDVRLSDYRGQIVLLNFWATWCGPCREELPHVQKLHEGYGDRGLVVIAVSTDGTKSPVSRFISREGYSFVVLMADGPVQQDCGVGGIPVTFFIDREGVIRHVKEGFGPGGAAELEEQVVALLGE